jgi:hypothetical protein
MISVVLAATALSACAELLPALPELREDYMGKSLLEPEWEPQVEHDERGEPVVD